MSATHNDISDNQFWSWSRQNEFPWIAINNACHFPLMCKRAVFKWFVRKIHPAENWVVKQRSMFALRPQLWGGRISLCVFTAFLAHPFMKLDQYSGSSFCQNLLAIQHNCCKLRPDAEGKMLCYCAIILAHSPNKAKLSLCRPWKHMGGVEPLLHAFLTSAEITLQLPSLFSSWGESGGSVGCHSLSRRFGQVKN